MRKVSLVSYYYILNRIYTECLENPCKSDIAFSFAQCKQTLKQIISSCFLFFSRRVNRSSNCVNFSKLFGSGKKRSRWLSKLSVPTQRGDTLESNQTAFVRKAAGNNCEELLDGSVSHSDSLDSMKNRDFNELLSRSWFFILSKLCFEQVQQTLYFFSENKEEK